MDADPVKSSYLKAMMRIDDEYFAAVAPDPTDRELKRIRDTLSELTRT